MLGKWTNDAVLLSTDPEVSARALFHLHPSQRRPGFWLCPLNTMRKTHSRSGGHQIWEDKSRHHLSTRKRALRDTHEGVQSIL